MKKSINGLFPGEHFLLHVHGCIQEENVINSINPSNTCIITSVLTWLKHSHIYSTHVEVENVQIFKDLKIILLHYFSLIFSFDKDG